jgi:hypothetical protein
VIKSCSLCLFSSSLNCALTHILTAQIRAPCPWVIAPSYISSLLSFPGAGMAHSVDHAVPRGCLIK